MELICAGSSGAGSYGRLAHFKADVLNDLIARHDIRTLIEWGCGDGHQSSLLEVDDYLGVDISESSVRHCRASHERLDHRIGRRAYRTVAEHLQSPVSARDCSISLDVVYHLTEDSVYEEYMRNLFASASRLVVVYASNNVPAAAAPSHIRHRAFTSWVAANQPEWALAQFIPNRYPFALGDPDETSFADFYVYAAPTS